MLVLYNVCRTLARGLAAGAIGVLTAGKAEPLGLHFDGPHAVLLTGGLLLAAFVMFTLESVCKRRAGV